MIDSNRDAFYFIFDLDDISGGVSYDSAVGVIEIIKSIRIVDFRFRTIRIDVLRLKTRNTVYFKQGI